jgi:hypothetical protein
MLPVSSDTTEQRDTHQFEDEFLLIEVSELMS